MGPKQNHSAISNDMKKTLLFQDKFSQHNYRIDVIEQNLNDTHKYLKIVTEVDKKALEAISAI